MTEIYIPPFDTSTRHVRNFFEHNPANLSDVLAEEFKGAARFGLDALNTIGVALESGFDTQTLSAEEYQQSEYYREGLTAGEDGVKESIAKMRAEAYDRRFKRNLTLNRARQDIATGAARFGASMAGSILDPVNIGLGMTAPVLIGMNATARAASARAVSGITQKYGVTAGRVTAGAGEATAGALAFEPIALTATTIEQNPEYGLFDVFVNLAAGAFIGGAMTGIGGKFSDKLQRVSPQVKMQAMRVAAGQMMEGKPVDVAPVLEADPEIGIAARAEREAADARAWERINNPVREKPKGKKINRYPRMLRRAFERDKPVRLTTFIKRNGGLKSKQVVASGDIQARLDKLAFTVLNNKTGLGLDEMTMRAQLDGYLGAENVTRPRLDVEALLSALEKDSPSTPVYSSTDPDPADYIRAIELRDEVERLGIDPIDMTDEQLFDEIARRENAMTDDQMTREDIIRQSGITDNEAAQLISRVEADPDDPSTYMDLSSEEESLERFDALRSGAYELADKKRFASDDSEIRALDEDIARYERTVAALAANDAISAEELAEIQAFDDLVKQYDEIDEVAEAGALCVMRG